MGVIYGLEHAGEIRYVGKTTMPLEKRLRHHLYAAKKGQTYVARWIRKASGEVQIVVLERDPVGGLNEAERAWIATLRRYGCRLTNLTDGGEGQTPGFSPSVESRDKMRKALERSNVSAAERGRRGGLALRGVPKSKEHREKISRSLTGRKRGPWSQEMRDKLSASAKARGFNHKTGCLCRYCENHRPMSARGGGA